MPGGDRTGPQGAGPGTGWGHGPCVRRIGFGRGFRSLGFRAAGFDQPLELSKDEKIKILEADKTEIETELKELEKQLRELKK